jgi:hypothetical protein
VVPGDRDRERHGGRVHDEECTSCDGAGRAKGEDGKEQAPADVHARHGCVGVEADPGERAPARVEPDGVGDMELGDEPRRSDGQQDVDDRRERDREQQHGAQLPVEVAVAERHPDEDAEEERSEAEQVVGGRDALQSAERVLHRSLAEQAERPLDVDDAARVRHRHVAARDRDPADGEVEAVERGPDGQLEGREAKQIAARECPALVSGR